MYSPFILETQPPDFFTENSFACKLRNNKGWAFSPCTTGINMMRTFSSGYRLMTLMPFHFIMPKPYNLLHKNAERSLYRCVTANRGKDLLINRLMDKALIGKPCFMSLGMLLHTFADTYAHEGFSGFAGWENASYVHEGMKPSEAAFYRVLPSIGHANVGSIPDLCGLTIDLYAKRNEKSAFESFIKRDNTCYFADCSRRILDILCAVNNKPPFGNQQWDVLQTRLAQAQNSGDWSNLFPSITYEYQKDEFVKIELEVHEHDAGVLGKLKIKAEDLRDVYSEESDRARVAALTRAFHVNDDFFKFNETAYRHVLSVTGDYCTLSHRTQLAEYCRMAEG